jgi:hypothetical protein
MAAAILGIGALIAPGRTLVLVLDRCSAYMLVVICKPLVGAGFVMDAFRPAAEADVAAPVNVSFVHTPAIVKGVMEAMAVYICDRGVVAEVVAMPLAAGKADAAIAEAVVDAAVVAYVPSPVALMEDKPAAGPTPVGGSPQSAFVGGRHPSAANPIKVACAPCPIARRPYHAGFRAGGLFVDR